MREQAGRLPHTSRKNHNSGVCWRAIWMLAICQPMAARAARGARGSHRRGTTARRAHRAISIGFAIKALTSRRERRRCGLTAKLLGRRVFEDPCPACVAPPNCIDAIRIATVVLRSRAIANLRSCSRPSRVKLCRAGLTAALDRRSARRPETRPLPFGRGSRFVNPVRQSWEPFRETSPRLRPGRASLSAR